MKSVLAIDPGSKKSGWIWWNGKKILDKGISPNEELLNTLRAIDANTHHDPVLAIETMQSIHEKSGKAIINTIFWSGRFYEAWEGGRAQVTRDQVKKALGAKDDAGVRAVLIQRFGAQGSKKNPGLTYGLHDHLWAAFALTVAHFDHLAFQGKELK